MLTLLLLACFSSAEATLTKGDNTISEVVGLLQDMLDKSKTDGKSDRELFGKFQCFCDTTTKEKNTAITDAQNAVLSLTALLEELRAHNGQLSQEVAHLAKSMEENEAAREEATNIRDKEHEDFVASEADMVTGISQLERAIDLLAAVGADQTESVGADHEQLMAAGATAAAGGPAGSFMSKKAALSTLSTDMKEALRAASVFLTGSQRKQVTAFVQAPGNYNAQSGEIVGIIKNMLDTFTSNLKSSRAAEEKALKEYDDFMEVKTAEFEELESGHNSRKKTIGDNSETIASKASELETVQGELASDQEFLADLTARCATKKKEYEHRTMLRANEDAAIAQAISILNSDAAFATFSEGGAQSFVQTKATTSKDSVIRGKVLQELLNAGRKTKSMKIARIAAALSASNPFEKVLAMIRETIAVIEAEGKTDEEKHAWCRTEEKKGEQDVSEKSQEDKETDMGTLEGNIQQLEISIEATKENIHLATEDLNTNRETQSTTTTTRKTKNALFHTELKNCQDVQAILAKAIEVLDKYYTFLASHNAKKTYKEVKGKDSGGGNLERLSGKSTEELEEACSAKPECKGFNSAGWLKSSMAPEDEWYSWDEGSLFIKELSETFLQEPVEGEPDAEFSTGQGEGGNQAIEMLKFIESASHDELSEHIDTERQEQGDFEGNMQALTASEAELLENIDSYKLDLANTEKQHLQAVDDLATTTKDRDAIVAYLASIHPGCTFIQTNIESRKQNREAETAAMTQAIELLEGTPAFKTATAAAEREALGECAADGKPCAPDGPGRGHAECEACLEGVTVFGYCAQNADAGGCADATKTSSADALALVHRKK